MAAACLDDAAVNTSGGIALRSIREGVALQIGQLIYHADLFIHCGQLHANVDPVPPQNASRLHMVVDAATIDLSCDPNCVLPPRVTMSMGLMREILAERPELSRQSFYRHELVVLRDSLLVGARTGSLQ